MNWILTKEKLPPIETYILMFKDNEINIGMMSGVDFWWANGSLTDEPVYWMPLPDFPKEE